MILSKAARQALQVALFASLAEPTLACPADEAVGGMQWPILLLVGLLCIFFGLAVYEGEYYIFESLSGAVLMLPDGGGWHLPLSARENTSTRVGAAYGVAFSMLGTLLVTL